MNDRGVIANIHQTYAIGKRSAQRLAQPMVGQGEMAELLEEPADRRVRPQEMFGQCAWRFAHAGRSSFETLSVALDGV